MPIIKRHQTLLDFAVQHAGSVEALLPVAQLAGISPTEEVAPGTLLQAGNVLDIKVVAFFTGTNDEIATNFVFQEPPRLEGIGYWIISLDFKVS